MPLKSDPLYLYFPDETLDSVALQVRVPDRVCDKCCDRTATRPYDVRGTRGRGRKPYAGGLVKIGSNPDERTIVVHPDHYKPGTATGEALRAHEMFHVEQRKQARREGRDFDREFTKAAIMTEGLGRQPWENPFEAPAYDFERQVKADLLQRGFPL